MKIDWYRYVTKAPRSWGFLFDRIEAIDILRGFALLGIPLSIYHVLMSTMAYFSPIVYGINLLNHIIYIITHIIVY